MLFLMCLPQRDSELIAVMDTALAEAAQQAGEWLVCRPGCAQCCSGAFAINALDALRLRAGMDALRSTAPDLAARIERRAKDWVAEQRDDFPGSAATGLLGDSDTERERFEEFANEAVCPALDAATGRCELYTWRPMTCRVFGPPVRMNAQNGDGDDGDALGCCELCFTGASEAEIAACEMPLPHELEAKLLGEIGSKAETVVAFALLK